MNRPNHFGKSIWLVLMLLLAWQSVPAGAAERQNAQDSNIQASKIASLLNRRPAPAAPGWEAGMVPGAAPRYPGAAPAPATSAWKASPG